MVFDGAEDPTALRALLPEGPGRVFVTSRNPVWPGTNLIEVRQFARDESVALLRQQAPELSKPDADRLAAALGDLPLALERGFPPASTPRSTSRPTCGCWRDVRTHPARGPRRGGGRPATAAAETVDGRLRPVCL